MKYISLFLIMITASAAAAAVITGTIKNVDGTGVPQQDVVLIVDKDDEGYFKPVPLKPGRFDTETETPERNVRMETRTDAEGNFSFEVMRDSFSGELEIQSETNLFVFQNTYNYFMWRTNEPTEYFDILMLPAVTISGRVAGADGIPIRHINIHAFADDIHRDLPLWTEPDEDGGFSMQLPYGDYLLQVVDNYETRDVMLDEETDLVGRFDGAEVFSDEISLSITNGTLVEFLTLTAYPSTIITGSLVNADGAPMADTRISTRSAGFDARIYDSSVTDQNGNFRIDLPLTESIEIVFQFSADASGAGFSTSDTEIKRVTLHPGASPYVALVAPEGRISGTIHESEEYDIRYHMLSLRDQATGRVIANHTSEEPVFTFDRLADGAYEIFYMSTKWPGGILRKPVTISGGEQIDRIHIAPGSNTLCGTLADANHFTNVFEREESGPAIGGILVQHQDGGPYRGWNAGGLIRPDGTFCISNIYEGTVLLRAILPGVQLMQTLDVEYTASNVRLDLLGDDNLSGRMLDEQGAPITNGTVVLRQVNRNTEFVFLSQADSNGVFHIKHLPRGSYDAVAIGNRTVAPLIRIEVPQTSSDLLTLTVPPATGAIDIHFDYPEALQDQIRYTPLQLKLRNGFELYPMMVMEEETMLVQNLPDGAYIITMPTMGGETNIFAEVSGGTTNRVVIKAPEFW